MGKPSLAGLLAAPRAVCPDPFDQALNPAGNALIGLNATKARFQMRGTVAVRQHGRQAESARAGLASGGEQAPLESEIPGSSSAGS